MSHPMHAKSEASEPRPGAA